MINNYLDYAKWQRKFAVTQLQENRKSLRDAKDSWSQGFYKGLCISESWEARRWRKLQKDIEARLTSGYEMSWMPDAKRKLGELLNR